MTDEAPAPDASGLADFEWECQTELLELVAQLHQYISFHELCGTDGLPRDRHLKERLRLGGTTEVDITPTRPPRVDVAWGDASTPPHAQGLRAAMPVAQPSRARAESALPLGGAMPGEVALPAQSTSTSARARPPAQDVAQVRLTPSLPVTIGPDLGALGDNLEELRATVAACTRCVLHTGRTQTVFARGNGSSGLCFVGEGPGADEDARGEPFVGAAGQLLDKMIAAMGFSRDEVYVCNIVKCRPPGNRKPLPEEMQMCSGFLQRQLELLRPHVIVALGATALEGLLGVTERITRVRGEFRLYQGRIAVMPTFHPAYLLRNPSAKKDVWSDLRQVVRHMGRTLP